MASVETLWRSIASLWRGTDASNPFGLPEDMPPVLKMYATLHAYYDRKDIYRAIEGGPKGFRNISRRAVEFHAQHLWPGDLPDALPIEAKRQDIIEPIHNVWTWSNWVQKKQVFARHLALYGDGFIKVSGSRASKKVRQEIVDPRFVTDITLDPQGFLVFFRIDKPQGKNSFYPRNHVYTEIWNKERGDRRIYRHEKGIGEAEEKLTNGSRVELSELGLDFLPIVHAPFQDDGDETRKGRGTGVFEAYLDDIDEANRVASRRHDLFFRYDRNTWALVHDNKDPEGNPLPPPRISMSGAADASFYGEYGYDQFSFSDTVPDTVSLGKDKIVRLFGGGKLESLIPNIDWGAAKDADDDMKKWLAEELPEIVYSQLSDKSDLSGRAIRALMAPAIDRGKEARGGGERAMVRADQIALTYGQKLGLSGFEADTIGTYDNGDFEHKFQERAIIPDDEIEAMNALQTGRVSPPDGTQLNPEIQRAVDRLGITVNNGASNDATPPTRS